MGLIRTADPTVEPLIVDEVRRHLRLDDTSGEPVPPAPAVALAGAGAGNLSNGAYRYRLTFVTADGETDGGDISAAVTVSNNTLNGRVSVTNIPIGGSRVTSRKLYRTVAGGSTYLLLETIANNTATTYTDNVADAALGAGVPTSNSTQDPEIRSLIFVTREMCEIFLGRALIEQTWKLTLDEFPPDRDFIALPRPNLLSVTDVRYIDTGGTERTMSAADYSVDAASLPGRILLGYSKTWPSTRSVYNAVTVTFKSGYGATAASVPDSIKAAMKLIIGDLYRNREAAGKDPLHRNPSAMALLWAHRYLEAA